MIKCPTCNINSKIDTVFGDYCPKCGLIIETYNERLNNTVMKKYKKKEKNCWGCASPNNLTRHHVIPKRANGGKGNNLLMLCKRCHKLADKISEELYPKIKRITMVQIKW